MSYKVFFVEDEIVTREGIRDNVDWQADGFELCGEASDGEMALPLLQAAKPDVLITDIKMPFMDGLQLSRIVRERLPHTKIVILSGHDEFEYAQEAIKLGVSEYLLKPVTVQDLRRVLQKVASKMDREVEEQASLLKLQTQVQENRAALIERLLLKLLVGGIALTEAIEQSELLGVDLIARCYLVVVIRIALDDATGRFDYDEYHKVQEIVSGVVDKNPDVFVIRKDPEELVLIIKGSTPAFLQEDRDFILAQIVRRVKDTRCKLSIGVGSERNRIADLGQSLIEAVAQLQNGSGEKDGGPSTGVATAELLKVDKSAVQDYLKCGVAEEFEEFFNDFILPLGETAARSPIVKNYIFLDLVFTAARFVQELGGDVDGVLPELEHIDTILQNIKTIEQIKQQAEQILTAVLAFRDSRVVGLHAGIIQQAKAYIDAHYMDPELSLHDVAGRVGHSTCHFSTMFGEETGQTFKEYLTELRVKRAKELMRTTNLRSFEISDQVGYNDPHYFSLVFRKSTGFSPKEFRLQVPGVKSTTVP